MMNTNLNKLSISLALAASLATIGCGQSGALSTRDTDIAASRPQGAPAPDGHDSGNGGYGIVADDGRVYSLDLMIRGVATNPALDTTGEMTLNRWDRAQLDRMLRKVATPAVTDIVAQKLAALDDHLGATFSQFSVTRLLDNGSSYAWINHPTLRCLDVEDDTTPYEHKIQLAWRDQREIRFCKAAASLDDANRAALILHEMVYASLTEKSRTVEFVGFLFDTDFVDFDEDVSAKHLASFAGEFEKRLAPGAGVWKRYDIDHFVPINEALANDARWPNGTRPCLGVLTSDSSVNTGSHVLTLVRQGEPCRLGVQHPRFSLEVTLKDGQLWVSNSINYAKPADVDPELRPSPALFPNAWDAAVLKANVKVRQVMYPQRPVGRVTDGTLVEYCGGSYAKACGDKHLLLAGRFTWSERNAYIDVATLGAFSAATLSASGVDQSLNWDLNACFGQLRSEAINRYAAWFISKGETCKAGPQYVERAYFFLRTVRNDTASLEALVANRTSIVLDPVSPFFSKVGTLASTQSLVVAGLCAEPGSGCVLGRYGIEF